MSSPHDMSSPYDYSMWAMEQGGLNDLPPKEWERARRALALAFWDGMNQGIRRGRRIDRVVAAMTYGLN